MPSSRRSRPRARSQPRFGPPPLDHSPPRRSPSKVPDATRSRAFDVLKIILQFCHLGSFEGRDQVSSGSTRLSRKGWELLQKILTMLRENFLYFYKPERRLKLTYYSKERTLYYTMPTIIPEKLATRIGYAIEDRIEDIIKEYSMHYDDDQVVDRDLRCWFTGGPWQISTREKWNEVRLDRVGYLGGSNVRYRQPFGLEFSFAQDFHILTDKVTKAMMQPRGPDMVILIRIGYDSAEAFEEAAVDPTAVAALDKTADYTIYQVFTEMTDDGQHRAQVHPSVYRRAFRASDGSAVEGDLEFTFGDFIGLKPEKVFLDPLIREKLLQQKITIPFSKLTKWLDRGESWETSDQLQMRQFGPFPPPEPVNVFPIADRDDSD